MPIFCNDSYLLKKVQNLCILNGEHLVSHLYPIDMEQILSLVRTTKEFLPCKRRLEQ